MVFTSKHVSPLKQAGTYVTNINAINEYGSGLNTRIVYELGVHTDEGLVEVVTSFNVNNHKGSPFCNFKEKIIEAYGDGCDTADHVHTVVLATFENNTTESGDEYCNLLSYKPYTAAEEEEGDDDFEGPF